MSISLYMYLFGIILMLPKLVSSHTCDGIESNDGSVCSYHGNCTSQDVCVCTPGINNGSTFFGDSCEFRVIGNYITYEAEPTSSYALKWLLEFHKYSYSPEWFRIKELHFMCVSRPSLSTEARVALYDGDESGPINLLYEYEIQDSDLFCDSTLKSIDISAGQVWRNPGYYWLTVLGSRDITWASTPTICTTSQWYYTGVYEDALPDPITILFPTPWFGYQIFLACETINSTYPMSWNCFDIPSIDSRVCNFENGTCVSENNCSCNEGYFGDECELWECGGVQWNDNNSANICQGNGRCSGPSLCECFEGYSHETGPEDCQAFQCFGKDKDSESVCNFLNGSCISFNNCSCNEGYFGDHCQLWKCDDILFYDSDDDDDVDPVCHGHGSCLSPDNCFCETGWNPPTCEYRSIQDDDDDQGDNSNNVKTSSFNLNSAYGITLNILFGLFGCILLSICMLAVLLFLSLPYCLLVGLSIACCCGCCCLRRQKKLANTTVPAILFEKKLTFALTKIRNGARLFRLYSSDMEKFLVRHDRLIRRLIEKHGGAEVKAVNGAFFVVFQSSRSALDWACEVQEKLLDLKIPKKLLGCRDCQAIFASTSSALRHNNSNSSSTSDVFDDDDDDSDYYVSTPNSNNCTVSPTPTSPGSVVWEGVNVTRELQEINNQERVEHLRKLRMNQNNKGKNRGRRRVLYRGLVVSIALHVGQRFFRHRNSTYDNCFEYSGPTVEKTEQILKKCSRNGFIHISQDLLKETRRYIDSNPKKIYICKESRSSIDDDDVDCCLIILPMKLKDRDLEETRDTVNSLELVLSGATDDEINVWPTNNNDEKSDLVSYSVEGFDQYNNNSSNSVSSSSAFSEEEEDIIVGDDEFSSSSTYNHNQKIEEEEEEEQKNIEKIIASIKLSKEEEEEEEEEEKSPNFCCETETIPKIVTLDEEESNVEILENVNTTTCESEKEEKEETIISSSNIVIKEEEEVIVDKTMDKVVEISSILSSSDDGERLEEDIDTDDSSTCSSFGSPYPSPKPPPNGIHVPDLDMKRLQLYKDLVRRRQEILAKVQTYEFDDDNMDDDDDDDDEDDDDDKEIVLSKEVENFVKHPTSMDNYSRIEKLDETATTVQKVVVDEIGMKETEDDFSSDDDCEEYCEQEEQQPDIEHVEQQDIDGSFSSYNNQGGKFVNDS